MTCAPYHDGASRNARDAPGRETTAAKHLTA